MAKPLIKFRTYRQSDRVGGKIYGVPNLGDPVVANVTMAEVIDYAKLHNYSADTLEALLSQVISGVAELVARDGRPRNLSDLLKFEPVIKGTFRNLEETVTDQKILVRPRLLKEIRVKLDAGNYSWQNQNDTQSPRLVSVAPNSSSFSEINLAAMAASMNPSTKFGFTYAGQRLCPNGWDANCAFEIHLITPTPRTSAPGITDFRLDFITPEDESSVGYVARINGDEATDNTVAFGAQPSTSPAWWIDSSDEIHGINLQPQSGDRVVFKFTRTVSSGDTFSVEKSYTL